LGRLAAPATSKDFRRQRHSTVAPCATQALQSAGLSRPAARKAVAIIKRAWRLALLRENELHLPGVAVRLAWRKRRPTRRLRWRAGKLKQFGALPPTTDRLRQRVAGSSRSTLVFRLDSVGEWYAVPRTIDRHRQRPWSSMQLPPRGDSPGQPGFVGQHSDHLPNRRTGSACSPVCR